MSSVITEAFKESHGRLPENGDSWDIRSLVSDYVIESYSYYNGTWVDMALEPITLTVEQAEALMLWSEAKTTAYGPRFNAAFQVARDVAKHLRGKGTDDE